MNTVFDQPRVKALFVVALVFGACGPDVERPTEVMSDDWRDASVVPQPEPQELAGTELTPPPTLDAEDTLEDYRLFLPAEAVLVPMEEPMVADEVHRVESCGFQFGFPERVASNVETQTQSFLSITDQKTVDAIAYPEPLPATTWRMRPWSTAGTAILNSTDGLTMPGYSDQMPFFERAGPWVEERRCYELPTGAQMLTQEEAYDLWVRIVAQTLWLEVDQSPGARTVVGVRGAYPGTFDWHGNLPNYFNDTIVLLWRDDEGQPNVREFPVNTDTGARNFGYHSSSSLRPNRHYPYVNGWHRTYNALRINTRGYAVRDDSNHNGHWDGDRNGWLNGGRPDHGRSGSGHNIHTAEPNRVLGEQQVNGWSAGCQVIPGTENWVEFLGNVWTVSGAQVDYFLVDARDISPSVWNPCEAEDGSHDCPYSIRSLPYTHNGDTSLSDATEIERYNCSEANEGGPELVYVLNIRDSGTLSVSVETDDETVDPDIHLLWGDDPNACLARDHRQFEYEVSPGRYVIVVDTWVNSEGEALSGGYRLNVELN